MFVVPKAIVEALIEEARQKAPIEACGYLAGEGDIVSKHYSMSNTDASREHFSLDPKEQFEVMRRSRQEGLGILAVYHSHPASPACPSEEDIKLAYDPSLRYVIVSLLGVNPKVKAFRIIKGKVEPEDIKITG